MNENLFPEESCTTCGVFCFCGEQERALRRIIKGDWPHGAMTVEQRRWAVKEAVEAGEGQYRGPDLEQMSDRELASAVLNAWTDYARSQGLL